MGGLVPEKWLGLLMFFSSRLFFSGSLEEPLSAELVEGTAWKKV